MYRYLPLSSIFLARHLISSHNNYRCKTNYFRVFPENSFYDGGMGGLVTKDHNSKWTKLLILAGIATTIGSSLSVGYTIGVVNAPSEIISRFCNESMYTRYGAILQKDSLNLLWSSIVSIFLLGGAIGSLTGSLLADRVGRKGALNISTWLAGIAAILFYFSKDANSVEMLILGRLLVGLASGLITCVMPMYLTELAPLNLRGSMGVLCPFGVTFGVLMGQIISLHELLGNEKYWALCLSLYLVPLLICGVTLPFLPESPKYLYIIKNKPQVALQQLSRIRNVGEEFLKEEIEEIIREQRDTLDSNSDDWSIKRLLTDKTLLLPLLLVCSLQSGQQFSGINAVFYYSVSIFKSAGLSEHNAQLANIGAGVCNLFMGGLSVYIMSRFNRRCTIQLSLSTSAFFLSLLGISLLLKESANFMSYISIIGVLGYVICYGIGLGPIPYFVASELFEVGPRPAAMALGSMANWGGNFCIGLLFPTMNTYLGASSFFIFSGIVVALFIFVRLYLPETRGVDPSEIAIICQQGFNRHNMNSPISSISTAETCPATEEKV